MVKRDGQERKVFSRGKKFIPIKHVTPAELPELVSCVCGAVVPREELEEHGRICDGIDGEDTL